MKDLKGKIIENIFIDDMAEFIIFETNSGKLVYECNAECCSETYISEIIGIRNIFSHDYGTVYELNSPELMTITEIEQMELGTCEKRTKQETDNIYGYKIKFGTDVSSYAFDQTYSHPTDASVSLLIIFRNSSNGYYGGCLTLSKEDKIPKNRELIKLTENYYGD
jgi:hypothetical protein